MATPQNTIRGLTVEDHGDGSYTVHRSGSGYDPEFAQWFSSDAIQAHEQVAILCRWMVEGRRGAAQPGEEAPYRPVTVQSVRIIPSTLNASRVWLGPSDGGTPQLHSDWR